MGRQVYFHMFEDDLSSFLTFANRTAPLSVFHKDSADARLGEVSDNCSLDSTLTFWNRDVLQTLSRKEIRRNGAKTYFRIDTALPVIELKPCGVTTWNGSEALLQGRIYSSFDQPTKELGMWYRSLERWLRRNLTKSPCGAIGGLIGQEALSWFYRGGILLPMFEPPITDEWLAVVAQQGKSRGEAVTLRTK